MKYLFLLAVIFTGNAFGCSCLHNYKNYEDEVTRNYMQSAVVVSAKAVGIEQTTEHGLEHQKVKWKVISSWKGSMKVNDSFSTLTDVESDTCGYSVYMGDKVIFYENEYGKFSLEICSIGSDSKNHVVQEKALKTLRKNRI